MKLSQCIEIIKTKRLKAFSPEINFLDALIKYKNDL